MKEKKEEYSPDEWEQVTFSIKKILKRIQPVQRKSESESLKEYNEKILKERAQRLAKKHEPDLAKGAIEVLRFQLAYEQYAIETIFVREVLQLRDITPLPHVPKFVMGLANIRGEIISVLDIRKFFDLQDELISDLNRLVIVKDQEMTFGFLVDRIRGLDFIIKEKLITDYTALGDVRKEYLLGITPERLIVLDAKKLINDKKIIVHQDNL